MSVKLSVLIAAALAGAAPAIAQSLRAPAADPKQTVFVITDQEGYGTGECLERQGGCGKLIADSFCSSKGFKSSEFYRKASIDDITGSLASGRPGAPREPLAFVIGCR
jgi:hypothetical protein